jgi:hypothetical protein
VEARPLLDTSLKASSLLLRLAFVRAGGLLGLEGNRGDCKTMEKQYSGKVIVIY